MTWDLIIKIGDARLVDYLACSQNSRWSLELVLYVNATNVINSEPWWKDFCAVLCCLDNATPSIKCGNLLGWRDLGQVELVKWRDYGRVLRFRSCHVDLASWVAGQDLCRSEDVPASQQGSRQARGHRSGWRWSWSRVHFTFWRKMSESNCQFVFIFFFRFCMTTLKTNPVFHKIYSFIVHNMKQPSKSNDFFSLFQFFFEN